MNFIIGCITVIGCVLGGYVLHHGNLAILWQPTEVLIIFGAAAGSLVIGSPGRLLKDLGKGMKLLFKGMPYKKDDYTELLTALFHVFKVMRTKGMLEMEQHIENPHESAIFSEYPKLHHNHHALEYLCTYLRLMTMGVEDYYQLEELMDREQKMHKDHGEHVSHTITNFADGMPALGIVAAVLGVIITMGSISEPPEILGGLIGAALVGTFLGILMAYGFFGPMGRYIGESMADEAKYLEVIKVALLAHVQGHAPAVSVEFARACISEHEKPAFADVEEACGEVSV
jgi:chemotaxis protein MotA